MLRLLQLSDIHFRPAPNRPRDIHDAVRQHLLDDVRQLGSQVAPVDAILVVGDVAARGKDEEYAMAEEFLRTLCEIVECSFTEVFCVPGNHDVDRSFHSPVNTALREQLRTAEPSHVHVLLERLFEDGAATEALHAPFAGFNRFARPLNCAVSPSSPVPAPWDIPFDGTTLRIHAVNSALVCDDSDSDASEDTKVVLGLNQLANCQRDTTQTISLVMCHHPLAWLRDRESVEPLLRRPQLLLTGHVHELGVEPDPDRMSLTIASGAVNPTAGDQSWRPSYNVIELAKDDRELVVSVRVRTYGRRARFGPLPGQQAVEHHRLTLDENVPMSPDPTPAAMAPAPLGALATPTPARSEERVMIYEIMRADQDARWRAAISLGLVDPTFKLVSDDDESQLALIVRTSGRLADIHEAVKRESRRG
jgi:3',5'-cyclic AMP phosphodiesterase CpdA